MKNSILTLVVVVAAAGAAYYFYKKSQTPAIAASGGGNGANASASGAYNGILNFASGAAADYNKIFGASTGHLANGVGGASPIGSGATISDTTANAGTGNDYLGADGSEFN